MKFLNNYLLYVTGLGLLLGILFYIFFQHIVFISIPISWKVPQKTLASKKSISLEIWNGTTLKKNTKNIVGANDQELLTIAIKHWLIELGEEVSSLQNIQLQSCMMDVHEQELFLSFDASFLKQDWSIEQKVFLIESLQRTLYSLCPTLTSIHYCTHYKPLVDSHLSFSQAWPISGFTSADHNSITIEPRGSTIILDHSGDERERGREIYNHYEYHITAQFEDELQRELNLHHIDTSLLRRENEWYDKEKKQRLLNRLNPALFIHITTYAQPERTLATLNIYYHCTHPVKDFWLNRPAHDWILQNNAHCANLSATRSFAYHLYNHLLKLSSSWRIKKPCGIPLTITEGILPPSLIIEIGLPNPKAWKTIIKPLCDSLETLLLD